MQLGHTGPICTQRSLEYFPLLQHASYQVQGNTVCTIKAAELMLQLIL